MDGAGSWESSVHPVSNCLRSTMFLDKINYSHPGASQVIAVAAGTIGNIVHVPSRLSSCCLANGRHLSLLSGERIRQASAADLAKK